MTESSTSLTLEYRLTEDDIRRYCLAGRGRKCWRCCLRRKVAMLMLAALAGFLFATCYHARGLRSAALAVGTTLAIVAGLAWARQARIDGHLCRLAGQMGLPKDLRLVLSPGGIVEEPDALSPDPARSFAWSEVLEIRHVDALTVLRLRRGGCLLFVPDRAFSSPQAREEFARSLPAWRGATVR